ncbi:transmembrane and tpr repeat-containing protein 2 [Plakobranchus ocellatus]|uniref:Transmembrane and tpr repeat-containing protein 2 n=1 Tax=Plakobranchus ocellatus TaxID=259542 RepID=A0AAV4B112_9GAST|nr:transmembrane and tpr repeat-containing protein 2 [Plakobranchus ocellatus]
MWPESEGRRGPNEVASCLFDYMKERSLQSVKEIHMFSNNCGGQDRNRYVAFALWFARNHLSLSKITHTFLEKGHTETENDSIHATIERATRRLEVYTPDQWYTAVRAARVSKQPYKVKEMTAKDFVDFKSMSNKVKNLQLVTMGRKLCGAEPGSLP